MGNFWCLFTRKKDPLNPKTEPITEQDKAVLELKVMRDSLLKYQKKASITIEKEVAIAKQLLKEGKKKQALLALKKKKYQEVLIERSSKQLMNLEEMVSSIEFSTLEKQVVEGLKQGAETLKQLNKAMDIDEVDKIMSDTAEAIQYQEEINNMISSQLTPEEDEAIENELLQLEAARTPKQPEKLIDLPDVPTNEPIHETPRAVLLDKTKSLAS